jgi:hypothetical protein
VLGRKVGDLPANYEKGEFVIDTVMDLETNVSNDFAGDNALLLKRGSLSNQAVVKMAQTFRTGRNDIDALDFVHMYLRNESQHHANLHDFDDLYVLVNFRPVVTKKNWRMDCGVAGYDNRLGLPPVFIEKSSNRQERPRTQSVGRHLHCSPRILRGHSTASNRTFSNKTILASLMM